MITPKRSSPLQSHHSMLATDQGREKPAKTSTGRAVRRPPPVESRCGVAPAAAPVLPLKGRVDESGQPGLRVRRIQLRLAKVEVALPVQEAVTVDVLQRAITVREARLVARVAEAGRRLLDLRYVDGVGPAGCR